MTMTSPVLSPVSEDESEHDCQLCPRLVEHRQTCRDADPEAWNSPVPAFADPAAQIVIIGLAPGEHGANRTGRPFTGDYSGTVLFPALERAGLAQGTYEARADDELELLGCAIFNSVKCLPPQNKPTPEEVRTCRPFLDAGIAALPNARIFIALGPVAHQSAVKVLGGRLPKARFNHLAEHRMPDGRIIIDSNHPSRQNTSTGRLTAEMLDAVLARAIALRDGVS